VGGGVRGRKVCGRWPGLDTGDLYEERDLPVTTDFREVAAAVLRSRMGLDDAQLDRVFPNRPRPTGNVDGLIGV